MERRLPRVFRRSRDLHRRPRMIVRASDATKDHPCAGSEPSALRAELSLSGRSAVWVSVGFHTTAPTARDHEGYTGTDRDVGDVEHRPDADPDEVDHVAHDDAVDHVPERTSEHKRARNTFKSSGDRPAHCRPNSECRSDDPLESYDEGKPHAGAQPPPKETERRVCIGDVAQVEPIGDQRHRLAGSELAEGQLLGRVVTSHDAEKDNEEQQ